MKLLFYFIISSFLIPNFLHAENSFEEPTAMEVESTSVPSESISTEGLNAESLYQKGLFHYQNSQWDQAQRYLQKALEKEPENDLILYNLGLAEFQLKRMGRAIAYWRKASYVNPNISPLSKALKHTSNLFFDSKEGKDLEGWESFRVSFLNHFRIRSLGFSVFLFMSLSCWFWLSFFGKKRRALEEETALPSFPYLAGLFSFVLLLSLLVFGLKAYDNFSPRGTVVAEESIVRSAPKSEASEIFKLAEGAEVLLLQSNTEWVQVSHPGGLTGWILKKQVFQTMGRAI